MRTEICNGELLAVGLFGNRSNLASRIEILLRRGRTFSTHLSGGRTAASLLILGALLFASALAPRVIAFAEQPSFEVASVKPGSGVDERNEFMFERGGKFHTKDASLLHIIQSAYEVQNHQIAAAPGWLSTATFDIQAKASNAATPITEMRLMVRSLLSERFKLALHREMREEPIYELVVDKGRSKLKEATESLKGSRQGIGGGHGTLYGMASDIPLLAQVLSQELGRSVIDKSGLTGQYDFRLHWTSDQPTDEAPISIFTAVQENLGLRLQSARGPVEVLVIDHVERPDAN